jgi:hypothetical protein
MDMPSTVPPFLYLVYIFSIVETGAIAIVVPRDNRISVIVAMQGRMRAALAQVDAFPIIVRGQESNVSRRG